MFCRKLLILCSNSLNDVSWVWVNYEMMYNFAIQLITCGNKVCWKLFQSGLLTALSILTWYWIQHTWYFEFTKDTQCRTLMGKLWGAFSEHVGNIDAKCVPKSFGNSMMLHYVLLYLTNRVWIRCHNIQWRKKCGWKLLLWSMWKRTSKSEILVQLFLSAITALFQSRL